MSMSNPGVRAVSLTAALALFLCQSAGAQQPAGSDWTKVQAIEAGTTIRVSAYNRRRTICSFVTADADSLICIKTQRIFFIPINQRLMYRKPDVTLIKLSHQLLSGLAGAGIGAGVGAGIGAGLESQQSSNEDGHLALVAFTGLFAALGSAIGSGTDFLAAPTVYRAP